MKVLQKIKKGEQPIYHLLNEKNDIVQTETKQPVYDKNGDLEKYTYVKNPVTFNQFTINSYKRMGQSIEVVTEADLKKEKELIDKLVEEEIKKRSREFGIKAK